MEIPKVLIIDDEKAIQTAMQKALKNEGYTLCFAENGKDGIKTLKKEKPALVFLDLRMPEMDGIEFLKQIKLTHATPYTVAVITGHGDDKDIEQCYKLGITNFLRKPLSMTEVCCLAKRCIEAKKIEIELEEHRNNLQSLVDHQTGTIKKQLQFQQTIIDSIPTPIYFKDTDLKIIGANTAFHQWFGLKKNKAAGLTFEKIFADTAAKKDRQKDEQLLKKGKTQEYQGKLDTKDGLRNDVVFNKAVFNNDNNETGGIIGALFDVTEREQAQRKLTEKSQALKHANMSLRILIKQLSDAQSEDRVNNMPNLKELVMPSSEQLEAMLDSPTERGYLENIMLNLNRVTSNFSKQLALMNLGLSPKEIQVADLIRIGLSNKESAIQMNVTKSTIEFHRDNLRKKLGLKHEKKNLRAFILALDAKMLQKK
jgi:PAS domain S-box-containing protein